MAPHAPRKKIKKRAENTRKLYGYPLKPGGSDFALTTGYTPLPASIFLKFFLTIKILLDNILISDIH